MRTLALITAAALLASSAAYADSVQVTSVTNINTPTATVTSMSSTGFKGPATIIIPIAGKVCKWVGSGAGPVPNGCNYTITVNNSTLALSNPTSSGGNVCTPTSQMLSLCH